MTAEQRRERVLCGGVVVLAAAVILYVFVHLAVGVFSSPAPGAPRWVSAASSTSTSTTAAIVPVVTTAAPTTSIAVAKTEHPPTAEPLVNIWDRLADCESGEWDRHGRPIPGTRRWDDRRGGYEGGLHFAPGTWDGFRPADFPDAAYLASREQQIAVAHRVLAAQGWGAWPVCSRKVGAR